MVVEMVKKQVVRLVRNIIKDQPFIHSHSKRPIASSLLAKMFSTSVIIIGTTLSLEIKDWSVCLCVQVWNFGTHQIIDRVNSNNLSSKGKMFANVKQEIAFLIEILTIVYIDNMDTRVHLKVNLSVE